jgi:hypothetical protein
LLISQHYPLSRAAASSAERRTLTHKTHPDRAAQQLLKIGIDGLAITRMAWSPTHQLGETRLYELQTRRMNEVLQLAQDLGYIK